jgi:predicted RNase H-like HicB family nuclease
MSAESVGVGYSTRAIEERLPDGRYVWFAYHPALPGCHAVGRDVGEATANLDRTREAWLSWADAHDVPVTPPVPNPSLSVQYAPRLDAAPAQDAGTEGTHQTIPVAA